MIGMHRSGTGMLMRLLEELGLFPGRLLEENHEALFFLQANDWALGIAGGAWDHPAPIRRLLAHKEQRALTVDYLRHLAATPHAARYLGRLGWLRWRDLSRLSFPWGWKDPRNTFTLPLWLDVFPGARIIHILRHGVDVAASLVSRESRLLEAARATHERRRRLGAYWLRAKRGGWSMSLRCAALEGGFELWEEYVREGRAHVAALGTGAAEVRYEEFLADPRATLARLAAFSGLEPGDEELDRVAAQVRPERAYAYRERPELRELARSYSGRLAEHGYGHE